MDLKVDNEGSIVVLTPLTSSTKQWIDDNCGAESWQWLGASLAIDWRFAEDIINGMKDAGFDV